MIKYNSSAAFTIWTFTALQDYSLNLNDHVAINKALNDSLFEAGLEENANFFLSVCIPKEEKDGVWVFSPQRLKAHHIENEWTAPYWTIDYDTPDKVCHMRYVNGIFSYNITSIVKELIVETEKLAEKMLESTKRGLSMHFGAISIKSLSIACQKIDFLNSLKAQNEFKEYYEYEIS